MNWLMMGLILLLGSITLLLLITLPTVILVRWILKVYLPRLRSRMNPLNNSPKQSQTIMHQKDITLEQATQTSSQE